MSEVVIAPISGGFFGVQLTSLYCVCNSIEFSPDICLAASGGTVACWMAKAGRWKPRGILEACKQLDSQVFIRKNDSPFANFLPESLMCWFSGSMYATNPNPEKFMARFFNSESATKTEVWVSAVNEHTSKLGLFCNRSLEHSNIRGENYNVDTYNGEPLRYLSGDLTGISRSMIASCSIPIMIDPTDVCGNSYIDSGVKFASPLTPLQDEIRALSEKNRGIHMTYISGYDVETSLGISKKKKQGTLEKFETIPGHIVRGGVISDRSVAIQIIRSQVKNSNGTEAKRFRYGICPISSLNHLLARKKKCDSSLIEIYPIESIEIDILNFYGSDVVKTISKMRSKLGVRVWWVESKKNRNVFRDVPKMLMTK